MVIALEHGTHLNPYWLYNNNQDAVSVAITSAAPLLPNYIKGPVSFIEFSPMIPEY